MTLIKEDQSSSKERVISNKNAFESYFSTLSKIVIINDFFLYTDLNEQTLNRFVEYFVASSLKIYGTSTGAMMKILTLLIEFNITCIPPMSKFLILDDGAGGITMLFYTISHSQHWINIDKEKILLHLVQKKKQFYKFEIDEIWF